MHLKQSLCRHQAWMAPKGGPSSDLINVDTVPIILRDSTMWHFSLLQDEVESVTRVSFTLSVRDHSHSTLS